jgi:hypothetical protein
MISFFLCDDESLMRYEKEKYVIEVGNFQLHFFTSSEVGRTTRGR